MADEVSILLAQLEEISPMPKDSDLTSDDLVKYEAIVRRLRTFDDNRMIRPLIAAFGYGEGFEVYWMALHLLERFDVSDVDPPLIDALTSDSPGARMWSALMLGRKRNRAATSALITLLNDQMELVRHHAVLALSMIDRSANKERISKLANDPSSSVRGVVQRVLAETGQG
jgi:HEAT repeat protein